MAVELGHWAKWMRLSRPGDDHLQGQASAPDSIVYDFPLSININPPPSWGFLTWEFSVYLHPIPALVILGGAGSR